jgi:LacI family transcriptional regulator
MAKQNTAPTMKDVAKEAGVSLGTVSKVINGIPVGEEYRKKVEQAIKELDYHLNAYARGLKSNRTNTIAVILPTIAHRSLHQQLAAKARLPDAALRYRL